MLESKNSIALLSSRHSRRVFLSREVPRALIEEILRAAAEAPSAKNMQPWRVTVVLGRDVSALAERILEKYDAGIVEKPDFEYYPEVLPEEWKRRAVVLGQGLFRARGFNPDDKIARRTSERANMEFFKAPAVLFFELPANAVKGTFLDMGFFLQNVMLGFHAAGLGSCPQYSVLRYTPTIREFLGTPAERILVCALPAGYLDETAELNRFAPAREPLEAFVEFFGEGRGK